MSRNSVIKMMENKSNTIRGYDKYEVEEAVRTLQRAKDIDSNPGLMEAVTIEVENQKQSLNAISKSKVSSARDQRPYGIDGI